jgi:hypothetical protein
MDYAYIYPLKSGWEIRSQNGLKRKFMTVQEAIRYVGMMIGFSRYRIYE